MQSMFAKAGFRQHNRWTGEVKQNCFGTNDACL
jgi:hypothetical protein